MKGLAPGWWVRCTTCGWTAPAEEIGMIRIGAASLGKRVRATCEACHERRWLAVIAADQESDLPPFNGPHDMDAVAFVRRRWLKIVPLLVLAGLAFVGLLFGGIQWYFNQHSLKAQAAELVADHPQVAAVLGNAPQLGWLIGGSIRNDTARLEVPINGTRDSGEVVAAHLRLTGHAEQGIWILDSCRLMMPDDEVGLELVGPSTLESD